MISPPRDAAPYSPAPSVDLASGDVLAAARLALRPLDAESGQLGVTRPPLSSNKAVIHFLGRRSGPPLYVAKMPRPACGAAAAVAQFQALQRCHAWWETEDRHSVSRPVALLPEADGFLMQYVPGPCLSRVLSQPFLQPAVALAAATAAGDFLRRFHLHARTAADEVEISDLVGEIRATQVGDFQAAGLSLPETVERILDRAPRGRLPARRVLLHGDYAPRNLILSGYGQVAMIDPVMDAEGLVEDDVATFLAMLSSASAFASGLVLPASRRLRLRLEDSFVAGYGADGVSPVICGLRLIDKQMKRWVYRRRRQLRPMESPLAALRARVIDAQMAALLEESASALDRAIAAMTITRSGDRGRCAAPVAQAPPVRSEPLH